MNLYSVILSSSSLILNPIVFVVTTGRSISSSCAYVADGFGRSTPLNDYPLSIPPEPPPSLIMHL